MMRCLIVAVAMIGAMPSVQAQDVASYPSRPVRLIVPSSAGGPVDAVARILADALKTIWKEAVVVESKPGAGNSTGALFVANAPPDGYTLLVISDSVTVNPSLYPALNKDPLQQFEAISVLVTAPQLLVARPDLPANDLRDFIAAAKANPGKLNVASAGIGTISHLTEVMLDQRMGIQTAHIPFRGAAPAVTALVGKHVDAAWMMPAPALPYVASGQLKALAVTSAARDPRFPQVATAEEAGIENFQIANWQGLFAPYGTPKPVVDKIADAVAQLMKDTEVRKRLSAVGFDARGDGPAAAAEQVRVNVAKWSVVVTKAGIKAAP